MHASSAMQTMHSHSQLGAAQKDEACQPQQKAALGVSSVASLMSGRGTVRGCLSSISSAVQQGFVRLRNAYSCHICRGD